MNQDKENRARRNYVSNLYPGLSWKERVAEMGTDRVTAIYLRAIRDGQKPKPEPPPERDISEDEDDEDDQLELF